MITRRPRFGFPGGVRLPGRKAVTSEAPVADAPLPAQLVVPLARHGGDPARPTVAVGDRVDRGTRIGRPAGDFSAAVHASSSGTVTAIEQRPVPHPSGLPETCVVVAPDGLDTVAPDQPAPMPGWPDASPATLRRRIADCGVVGLGGAAFPAAVKVTPGSETDVQLLIINAIECEPWITCDDRLLRERAEEVMTGVRILRHVLGAAEVMLALEEDKTAARDAVAAVLDAEGDTSIALAPVPVRYPVGGEKQLIQTLTGQEVPSGGLPLDIGVLCHNAGTAAAVARAVVHGEPLTDRVVTVAGTGVGAPQNLRARIGTPLATLVAAAGDYHGRVNRLVIGGPMMGFGVTDDAVPVSKGCNCVLVGEDEAFPEPEPALPCIRCGDCADACPVSLQPQQLFWHARAEDFEALHEHALFDCIECGACAYVCPSHLPLVGYYRHAKDAIRGAEAEQRFAEQARERYAFRQQRLEREQREQAERRERKKAALQGGAGGADKKAEINAAIARARERKRSGGDGS